MKYKVRRQGENLGEFSLEELTRRRETGEFSGGEYVQLAGALDWQPLDSVIQHGYRTAPSTPPPLATGEAVITITAQTAQGGVNTQQKKIIIQ